jgi:hypothetical protein
VRVKPGTADPDFPDIPLGGWAGTITEVDQRSAPPTYLIEWNKHTLDHMHPVYRKRCERDGLELESMVLGEDDIEQDTGGPGVIEQPPKIVTRPLSARDGRDHRHEPDPRVGCPARLCRLRPQADQRGRLVRRNPALPDGLRRAPAGCGMRPPLETPGQSGRGKVLGQSICMELSRQYLLGLVSQVRLEQRPLGNESIEIMFDYARSPAADAMMPAPVAIIRAAAGCFGRTFI